MRKLFVAFVCVVFNSNGSFQMAAITIVILCAYGLHLVSKPYMFVGNYEEVLRLHNEAAFTSSLHARLRASIAGIESRGKKKVHKNLLTYDGKVDRKVLLSVLTGWFFDPNQVEAILLFICAVVSLMGVIVSSQVLASSSYVYAQEASSDVAEVLIIIGIVYAFAVVATEIYIFTTESFRAKNLIEKRRSSRSLKKHLGEDGEDVSGLQRRKSLRSPKAVDEASLNMAEVAVNPLFASQKNLDVSPSASRANPSTPVSASAFQQAVQSFNEPPPKEAWNLIRDQFSTIAESNAALAGELMAAKAELDKLRTEMVYNPVSSSKPAVEKTSFGPSSVESSLSGYKSSASTRRL
jgi:hypothetical protein